MLIKKADKGCKLITIDTDMIRDAVFNDYSNVKNFVNGVIAYNLSQAIIRVTTQDFGDHNDVTKTLVMENKAYDLGLKAFLLPTVSEDDSRARFWVYVARYLCEGTSRELSQRYVDYMEYITEIVEPFFNELVNRMIGKFSRYDDKLVLVNCDLVTPGILTISYKTVMKTESLAMEYQCQMPTSTSM